MKHLYLLFSFFICLQISAQDFTGQWYLHSITIDGVQQENTYNYFADIVFAENEDDSNTYFYEGSAFCNSYFTEEPTTIVSGNTLSLPEPGSTFSVCADINYEVDYLSLFNYNHPNNAIFSYTISGVGDDETLILTNEENNFATYGRLPLTNDDLLDEWQLIYIEVDGDRQYSTIPNSENYINFENATNMHGGVCSNGYAGDYTQLSSNSFSLESVVALGGFCNYDIETDVFLHPYLWEVLSDENASSVFDYEITGTGNNQTLQITNSLGNLAYYTREGLPENHLTGIWYLHEINVNGTSFENIHNPQYNIEFTTTQASCCGIQYEGTAICNDYFGIYNLDTPSSLLIENYTSTLAVCDEITENDFESDYMDIFQDTNPVNITYTFTGTGDDENMILTNPNGDYARYGRQQRLSTESYSFALNNIQLVQNPIQDKLTLTSTIQGNYTIYTMNGKQLTKTYSINGKNIDVSQLSSGLYFLDIVAGTTSKTIKFIKK